MILADAPVPADLGALAPLVAQRFGMAVRSRAGTRRRVAAPVAHGDLPRWRDALEALPPLTATHRHLSDLVTADGPASEAARAQLARALSALKPWRKGPFRLFGVHVDSEWRSDRKWRRVAPHLQPLAGRRVLDVGCGNGYFGWRMRQAGAAEVVGVDPTLLFCLQHRAVNHYLGDDRLHVLPVRFEELPPATFDTVFSMGVVYHRRDPAAHVTRLHEYTRPGGQVVLESLVVSGSEPLVPAQRYARMRNVHVVPTVALMIRWLREAGFTDVGAVNIAPTTAGEQRTTAWMPFQSLADALDPARPHLTVEGYPAPVRAVVTARKPV